MFFEIDLSPYVFFPQFIGKSFQLPIESSRYRKIFGFSEFLSYAKVLLNKKQSSSFFHCLWSLTYTFVLFKFSIVFAVKRLLVSHPSFTFFTTLVIDSKGFCFVITDKNIRSLFLLVNVHYFLENVNSPIFQFFQVTYDSHGIKSFDLS